jgi:hypothetical protein
MRANPEDEVDVNRLPPNLSERVRVLRTTPVRKDGDFVLYWMHHAVRGHENPALDTALTIAGQFKLPVLVYQGLGGRSRHGCHRDPPGCCNGY